MSSTVKWVPEEEDDLDKGPRHDGRLVLLGFLFYNPVILITEWDLGTLFLGVPITRLLSQ